jgi:arylsulfatase A-like enzyme
MRSLIFIVFILAFTNTLTAQTSNKPNIIFIIADDLGYGDLGCYGQQKIETPHIDNLAKEGLQYNQFYSGTTVCAPSRAALMTGLHTGHAPVRGNKGFQPEGQTPLPDSSVTIAMQLQQRGYETAAFGKWGLGYITTSGDPNKKGFDLFVGYNCQSLAHNYYPDHLWRNHDRIDFPQNNPAGASELGGISANDGKKDSVYSGDYIHNEAMKFINDKHSKPYFLFLPYTLPHGDVIAPHDDVYYRYIRKFNEQPLKERPANYSNKNRALELYPHAAFAAMVSRLDKYVGEIVAALKANGTLENTIIVFTSDNGPHKENGGDPEFFDSNGPFRGIKRDMYEGGIRVPFIVSWKGKIKPGVPQQAAALWDMYPTFLSLAGESTLPKNIDGLSLADYWVAGKKEPKHDCLYWEFHEQNGKQALLIGAWKAVRLNVSTDPNAPVELYNLDKDPPEKENVASTFPEIAKQMLKHMQEEHASNPDWPLLPAEKKN